jgi:pSer/pThr/pTyr-binding forkhead associated (FHA) protein
MGTLLAKLLAGGAAGLLAWAIVEPMKPQYGTGEWARWEGILILTFGSIVGLVVGGYDGYTRGGKIHLLRGLGLGFLLGGIGGLFGHGFGAGIAQALFGAAVLDRGNLGLQIMARTVAFVPLGLFLGAAIGGSSLTVKRMIQGAVGGAIGGLIGGLSFDLIGTLFASTILTVQNQTHGEVGGPSRAVALTLMGAAIGLFIGLVEMLTRSAWLRIEYGRNEFKEWSIDSAETFIGRSESASVFLRGDANVQPIHAVIRKQGQSYTLADGGSPVGTLLNGQFIQQAPLASGSIIQIASFRLQFLIKGVPAPAFAPDGFRQQPLGPQNYPSAPMPQQAPQMSATQMPQAHMPMGQVPGPQFAAAQMPGVQTVAFSSPVAAAGIGFALVALDGPLAGQRFPVNTNVEVGREGAQIKLAGDANASRRHSLVTPAPGGVRVSDLGSTNGTFLNGQRIQTGDAKQGDIVRIGNTSFRVEVS